MSLLEQLCLATRRSKQSTAANSTASTPNASQAVDALLSELRGRVLSLSRAAADAQRDGGTPPLCILITS